MTGEAEETLGAGVTRVVRRGSVVLRERGPHSDRGAMFLQRGASWRDDLTVEPACHVPRSKVRLVFDYSVGYAAVMTTILRAPSSGEAYALTELCMRAKAVWGYDSAFLEACRAELTVRPERFMGGNFCVAERDSRVVGVAELSLEGETAALEKLFVEPDCIGSGVGMLLWGWAVTEAEKLGASTMIIEADPDAAGFYRKMGAEDVGTVPSGSIPGRVVSQLRHRIR